jgi:hypothetical protein
MVDIVNAAPMVYDLGTQDLSTRTLPTNPLTIPQHLPKFYVFAEKGPLGPNYVDFGQASITYLYGDNTFDQTKKYYTPQTLFLNLAAANANNCVVHRLVAPDAKDAANFTLYLDVLPTSVPLYNKNTDGSLALDANGNPVPKLDADSNLITVQGYKVKWVVETSSVAIGSYIPNTKTVKPGTMVAGSVQSTKYPIIEEIASSQGEYGNTLISRLYAALSADIIPFPVDLLSTDKTYPYYFQMLRVTDTKTGKIDPVLNIFGSQYSTFVLSPGLVRTSSGAVVDFKTVVTGAYVSTDPNIDTGLGSVFVYNDNITTLATNFYNAEKVIDDQYRDSEVNTTEQNIFAINMLSFVSSNGSPYQALKLVDDVDSVRLTKNTNVFLGGSSDGTITLDLIDSLVAADMDHYEDPLHEYNDLVLHPESIIYDSGFSLATKKSMIKFISRRKDTFVVSSTYAYNAPALTIDNQYSVAITLKTMYELYPESSTFGTGVMRGIVIGGSGTLIGSNYTNRVPCTYELLDKASQYMGASNGAWKAGFVFDKAPNSVLTKLTNIDVTWVPTSTRNLLWNVGLNFALNYQIRSQFFPALQTVYENDTSVLNSFFTAVAISYLNKVAHSAWREFSGSISYTNAQLEEKVNTFVSTAVKDKFDGKFVIVPNATVTEYDATLGYAWTLPIKIYANNSKTVMTAYTQAYRLSDLAV